MYDELKVNVRFNNKTFQNFFVWFLRGVGLFAILEILCAEIESKFHINGTKRVFKSFKYGIKKNIKLAISLNVKRE